MEQLKLLPEGNFGFLAIKRRNPVSWLKEIVIVRQLGHR